MEKILIVTGGSKGIGKGIVAAYLEQGYRIFSISRTADPDEHTAVTCFSFDLTQTAGIPALLDSVFAHIDQKKVQRIVLINNAGTLGQVGSLETLSAATISETIQLNLTAPLILVSAFMACTAGWSCTKKIINISSGAAQNPYAGWSAYCATKAGLDMMTKVVAAEQDIRPHGTKIIAIYPGVVDTAMQTKIRAHTKADFPAIDRFLELKASGSLSDPLQTGKAIWDIDQADLANGTVIRI